MICLADEPERVHGSTAGCQSKCSPVAKHQMARTEKERETRRRAKINNNNKATAGSASFCLFHSLKASFLGKCGLSCKKKRPPRGRLENPPYPTGESPVCPNTPPHALHGLCRATPQHPDERRSSFSFLRRIPRPLFPVAQSGACYCNCTKPHWGRFFSSAKLRVFFGSISVVACVLCRWVTPRTCMPCCTRLLVPPARHVDIFAAAAQHGPALDACHEVVFAFREQHI